MSSVTASPADAAALLLDAHIEGQYGGTGQVFDWRLLPDTMPLPWILSGGLNQDNVSAAVRQTGAAWLDVSSGVEQAPGIKSRDLMADFIQKARG